MIFKVWLCFVLMISSSLQEEDIDNELLIEEVEKRPALYAKNFKQYSDIILKTRLWDEIVLHLFPTRSLSQEQKENAVIQRRWKNLRACFSRELRCQKDVKSGQAAPKQKRYVYFDKLLFLVPSMEPGRKTSSNVTSLDEESISENDSSTPAIKRPTKEKKKNKSYEESLLEVLRDKTNHQDIQTPPDPDNYLALSLVPLLKSIPPDQKIDAQIAILNTLKCYTQSSSNYNNYNSIDATYILPQPKQRHIISQQVISPAQPAPPRILPQPIMSTTQPQSQATPPRVLSQQCFNPSASSTSTQSFYDNMSPPRSNETVQSYVSNYSVHDYDIENLYASD